MQSEATYNKEIVCMPLTARQLSHDLRTPLVPILGFTSELLETDLTPEQRRYVIDIAEAGQQLLKLANKLIELKTLAIGNLNEAKIQQLVDILVQENESEKTAKFRLFI